MSKSHFLLLYGDIFNSTAEALVNPVNCEGVSGAGLALAFKNVYPENQKEYEEACMCGYIVPGVLYVVDVNSKYIVNFPTKLEWRYNSKMEYIHSGLEKLVKFIKARGIRSIAIPALGCGKGNLNWDEVKAAIIKHLEPIDDLIVELYQPL